MKQIVSRAIKPTKSERAERTAQELLHEIFGRGTSDQIEGITHTLGIFVEVIRERPDLGRGTVIDIGGGKTGEGARPDGRRFSFQPGGAAA